MAAPNPGKPFGMYDIKVTDITGTTQVDLPAAMKLTFKERLKTGELSGDDKLQAVASFLEAIEWELEAGGISLEAWAIMTGRTLVTAGTSPAETKTLTGSGATRLPYFKLYGRSLGDGDDDVHILIYKAKVTDGLEGTLGDGEFLTTGVKGIGVDDDTNGIYDVVIDETAADVPSS